MFIDRFCGKPLVICRAAGPQRKFDHRLSPGRRGRYRQASHSGVAEQSSSSERMTNEVVAHLFLEFSYGDGLPLLGDPVWMSVQRWSEALGFGGLGSALVFGGRQACETCPWPGPRHRFRGFLFCSPLRPWPHYNAAPAWHVAPQASFRYIARTFGMYRTRAQTLAAARSRAKEVVAIRT